MLSMDVFNSDPFSLISMTQAVDKLPYIPTFLRDLGLFRPVPVNSTDIMIEERGTSAAVIQTSPRGVAPKQTGTEKPRKARKFETVRLADASTITASELQNIRAFGTLSETNSLQLEIARRQFRIKQNFELTKERLRLTCLMGGIVKDADNSVIVNWGTELNNAVPAPVAFDFSGDGTEGLLKTQITNVSRAMKRSLVVGNASDSVQIGCLAGDNWFDKLTGGKETRAIYLQTSAAQELLKGVDFATFRYGNVTFYNYRGSDDVEVDGDNKATTAGTVGIPPNEAWFFPISQAGGESIFQWAMAPSERLEFVNTPGQDLYSWVVPDLKRNMYADVEMYSYPLPVCTLPSALRKGTIA